MILAEIAREGEVELASCVAAMCDLNYEDFVSVVDAADLEALRAALLPSGRS